MHALPRACYVVRMMNDDEEITMKSARRMYAGRSYTIRKKPTNIPAHLDRNGEAVPAATVMVDVKVRSRSPIGPSFRAWARERFKPSCPVLLAAALKQRLSPKLAAIVGRD